MSINNTIREPDNQETDIDSFRDRHYLGMVHSIPLADFRSLYPFTNRKRLLAVLGEVGPSIAQGASSTTDNTISSPISHANASAFGINGSAQVTAPAIADTWVNIDHTLETVSFNK